MSSAVIDSLSLASGVVAQGGEATAGRNCTQSPGGNKPGTSLRAFPPFVSFLEGCFVRFATFWRTVSTVSRLSRRSIPVAFRLLRVKTSDSYLTQIFVLPVRTISYCGGHRVRSSAREGV